MYSLKFKRIASFLLIFCVAFCLLAGAIPASAAENGFSAETLTLTPGRNTSEINLTWYGDAADGSASNVIIAEASAMTGDTFPAGARVIAGAQTAVSEGKISHKAVVDGLAPDTEYKFCVSNDWINYSEVYTFKTPGTDSFSFAVTGDPQLTVGNQDSTSGRADETTKKGWQDTIDAITDRGVDFIAGVGDQVDITNNGSEDEYANFFAPDSLRSTPYAPAVGNHDRHYLFNYHYNIPNEQSFNTIETSSNKDNQQYKDMEVSGNYYYLYNNALFVVLNDSGYPESKAVAEKFVTNYDETLKAATTAHAGQYTWLFVQHHKSTASVADHCADRDIQYYVEAGFEKLMDKYQVDFVLAGHDHVYARSYPMLDGMPDKTGVVTGTANTPISGGDGAAGANNPGGTVYFTTTTASGLKYYELFNNAGNLYVKDNEDYPYLVNGLKGSAEYMNGNLPLSAAKYLQNKTPGYLYVEVSAGSVVFRYYDLDDYSATPFDTYTVTKTPEAPSASPTSSAVLVNGTGVVFDAYNINDNNYLKLRDIAYVLTGTEKQFEIEWDDANNTIILTSGQPYIPVGGEMAGKGSGDKTATPTYSKIYLDGKEARFTAYNIDGNNYFKLRDIGAAFDFSVQLDGANNTIVVDTSRGYTPE